MDAWLVYSRITERVETQKQLYNGLMNEIFNNWRDNAVNDHAQTDRRGTGVEVGTDSQINPHGGFTSDLYIYMTQNKYCRKGDTRNGTRFCQRGCLYGKHLTIVRNETVKIPLLWHRFVILYLAVHVFLNTLLKNIVSKLHYYNIFFNNNQFLMVVLTIEILRFFV